MFDITVNSNVRDTVLLIESGEANNFLDIGESRYVFDTSLKGLGTIQFTEFDLRTKQPKEFSYQYRYGMQTKFGEVVLGPGPRTEVPVVTKDFPRSRSDSPESGSVIPRNVV